MHGPLQSRIGFEMDSCASSWEGEEESVMID